MGVEGRALKQLPPFALIECGSLTWHASLLNWAQFPFSKRKWPLSTGLVLRHQDLMGGSWGS